MKRRSPEFMRAPDNGGNGTPNKLRPARGELPVQSAEFIKPLSGAAARVNLMKDALSQIGEEQPKISDVEIRELLPYYERKMPMPDKSTREGKRIWNKVALNIEQLESVHRAAGDSWMRDKNNAAELARLATLNPEGRELTALGIPYTPKGSGAEDLPDIPPALWLALHEDENIAHNARKAFLLALKGVSQKNTPEGKLCEIFALMFKERNRSHIDAHDTTMRNQLDNAALALLTYKIIFPVVQKQAMGDGTEKDRVGFGINLKLLERHAEVFLVQQQWERLEKALSRESDPYNKEKISRSLGVLRDRYIDATTFVKNIENSFGIKKPRTIFESFGNRLYVRGSDLPAFDEPQPNDAERGRTVSTRSLDAALRVLKEREVINEEKFRSDDLTIRSAEFSHILQTALIGAREFEDSVAQFSEGIPDEDTLMVARGVLKQIIDKSSEVRRVLNSSEATISKVNVSEASNAERKSKFEPIKKLAEKTLAEYENILSTLGSLLFVQKNVSEGNFPSPSNTETLSADATEKLQSALREITQNRALIQFIQGAINNPAVTRQEISSVIDQFLSDLSVVDK